MTSFAFFPMGQLEFYVKIFLIFKRASIHISNHMYMQTSASVFARFFIINWAILSFLINRLRQSFCLRFKKKSAGKNKLLYFVALKASRKGMHSVSFMQHAKNVQGIQTFWYIQNP
jgi:hypothetical protein